MAGLDKIPLRIPERWDPRWFEGFVRDVLALADIRNAVSGAGIQIQGGPSTVATVSSDGAIDALAEKPFVVLDTTGLPNSRKIQGTPSIYVNDAGPGGALRIGLNAGGIFNDYLVDRAPLSVMGQPADELGQVQDIRSDTDDTLLIRTSATLSWGQLTAGMAPDALWPLAKLDEGVQASLALADTAVQPARAITAGAGLAGGGDLSADRALALDAASIASLARADTALQPGTTIPAADVSGLAAVATSGAYADLTGAPTLAAVATSGAYSDLTGLPILPEALAALSDVDITTGAGVDGYSVTWSEGSGKFVLTDVSGGGGGGAVDSVLGTADQIDVDSTDPAHPVVSLDAAALADLALAASAVQPARTITAGTGLTGGGDLSADRTLALDAATIASLALADSAVQPGSLAAVAMSGAYSDLTGAPTLPEALVGLSDVDMTPGTGEDGYSVTWNDAAAKFVLSNVSGGGGGSLDRRVLIGYRSMGL